MSLSTDWEVSRVTYRDCNNRAITDDTPVADLEVSTRVATVFARERIRTVGDVRRLGKRGFLVLPNIGVGSLREIEDLIGPLNNNLIGEIYGVRPLCGSGITGRMTFDDDLRSIPTADLLAEIARRCK